MLAESLIPNAQLFADGTVVVDPNDGLIRVACGGDLVEGGSGAASSHSCDPNAPPPSRPGGSMSHANSPVLQPSVMPTVQSANRDIADKKGIVERA